MTLLVHLRRNVVAYLALVIALGGTSYAATALPRDSVSAKQIKTGAVRAAEVKDGSLQAADFAAGQVPVGAPGPVGPAGPRGEKGEKGEKGDSAIPAAVPAVRVYRTSNVSIAASSGSTLGFDAETYDPADMHSTTASTDQLKAPLAGVYAITATVAWDSGNGAGARGATLIRNGDINDQVAVSYGPASPTANVTGTNVSGQVRLAAGDTIAVVATNASGAPAVVRGLTAPVLTHLEMTFLSR